MSEPNNNIGLLKVRQADEETQTLVVQILEDAIPKSYEGLQAFFCARIGQTAGLGIIEQKLNPEEMTDPKNGKLEYTLRAEDWQVLGRQNGYFSFRKMADDHTYAQQFSTRDFTYEVTKNIYSDGIKEVTKDGSTYVWTFEDLLRLLQEFKDSGETDFLSWFDEIKGQLSEDAAGNLMLLYQSLRDKTGSDNDFRPFEADESFMKRVYNESRERGINIKWYGAVGDGIHDDTFSIQEAIDSCEIGDTVLVPTGVYRTTDTIVINKTIKLIMMGALLCDHSSIGILAKSDSSRGNFFPRDDNNHFLEMAVNIERTDSYQQSETATGIEIWNCFSGKFHFKSIKHNYTGVKMIGSKYGNGYEGFSYCDITLGTIKSYKENLTLLAENTGYVTQNQFYSGSLTGEYHDDVETIHVLLSNTGTSVINENTFFGVSFEGGMQIAIRGQKATTNKFISSRFEMPNLRYLFDWDSECRFNSITLSDYVAEHMYKNLFNDAGKNNYVSFIQYRLGYVEYYDRIFYIKPNRDTYEGSSAPYKNSVAIEMIPSSWGNVKIITSDMRENRIDASASNVSNNKIIANLKISDMILVVDNTSVTFDSVIFTAPPASSKEFMVRLGVTGAKPIKFEVDSTISKIVDKTGKGTTSPIGTTFVKLLYHSYNNTIYILDYIV